MSSAVVELLRLTIDNWRIIIHFTPVTPHHHLNAFPHCLFSFLFFPFSFFFSFLLPWASLTDFRLPRLPFHISWCIICTMASPCKLRKRWWQFQFDRSPVCTKSVDTASWLPLARCAEQYVQTVPPSSWQIAGETCRLQTILPPWGGLTGSPWTSSYILCKFHTDKKHANHL